MKYRITNWIEYYDPKKVQKLEPHTSFEFDYETLNWLIGLALENAAPLPYLNDVNNFADFTERYADRNNSTEQSSISETSFSLEERLCAVIKYNRYLASKNHL